MKVLFKYLRLLSLSTSGALLLCIVFAANPEIAEGTITGKVFWFHFSILLLAFSVLFMEATVKKSNFTFSLPDGLLLLFAGLALLNYNYELDPEPERLLFVGQITTLWFMLRATLQAHPELRLFLPVHYYMYRYLRSGLGNGATVRGSIDKPSATQR